MKICLGFLFVRFHCYCGKRRRAWSSGWSTSTFLCAVSLSVELFDRARSSHSTPFYFRTWKGAFKTLILFDFRFLARFPYLLWHVLDFCKHKCVMGLLFFSPFPEAVAFFHFNHYFFPHVHVKETIRKRPGPTSCAVQCCLHPKGKSALMTFRHRFFVTECER